MKSTHNWRRPSAVAVILLIVSVQTQAAQTADQYFDRAARLAEQGMLARSEHQYLLGLKLNPNSPAGYNNLGVVYVKERKLQKAVGAFDRALRLRPHDPEISFNLGLALFNESNPRAAIAALQTAIQSRSHGVDARYLLGVCYFGLKEWTRSAEYLEQAKRDRIRDDKILFLLYNDYLNTGKTARSMDAAAELLKTNPDSPFVYQMLGEAQDEEGRPRLAEQQFKKAIAALPMAPELHFLLGYLYWRWKLYDQVIVPLQQEIRINPAFAAPHYYLGDIALKKGQIGAALDDFHQALKLDASYPMTYLGLGEAYARMGNYKRAVSFLRQAVDQIPNDPAPHYWLGRALFRLGRRTQGDKELAEVARIHAAESEKAEKNLRRVRINGPGALLSAGH